MGIIDLFPQNQFTPCPRPGCGPVGPHLQAENPEDAGANSHSLQDSYHALTEEDLQDTDTCVAQAHDAKKEPDHFPTKLFDSETAGTLRRRRKRC